MSRAPLRTSTAVFAVILALTPAAPPPAGVLGGDPPPPPGRLGLRPAGGEPSAIGRPRPLAVRVSTDYLGAGRHAAADGSIASRRRPSRPDRRRELPGGPRRPA